MARALRDDAYDRASFAEFNEVYGSERYFTTLLHDELSDIFTSLYKEKLEFTEQPPTKITEFINTIKNTEEFKSLKTSVVNKPGPAYIAAVKLLKSFDTLEKPKNEVLRKLFFRGALKDAEKEAEEFESFAAIVGYGEGGEAPWEQKEQQVTPKALLSLMDNEFVKSIMELLGKLYNSAHHAINNSVDRGVDSFVGIELGDDFDRILSSELSLLTMGDVFADDFMIRLSEKDLVQVKGDGRVPKHGNDPIILLKDESGSMRGACNKYATAFMYAMYVIAKKRKRRFHVIRFSSDISYHEINSAADITALLGLFLTGGTNFNKPFSKALEILDEDKRMEKADIIMVTDALASIDEGILTRLTEYRKKGLKIISALIKADTSSNTSVLSSFSDKVFSIANIDGADGAVFAEEVFGGLLNG